MPEPSQHNMRSWPLRLVQASGKRSMASTMLRIAEGNPPSCKTVWRKKRHIEGNASPKPNIIIN
eukprot:6350877-Pyramimonas_sp.AAC.1